MYPPSYFWTMQPLCYHAVPVAANTLGFESFIGRYTIWLPFELLKIHRHQTFLLCCRSVAQFTWYPQRERECVSEGDWTDVICTPYNYERDWFSTLLVYFQKQIIDWILPIILFSCPVCIACRAKQFWCVLNVKRWIGNLLTIVRGWELEKLRIQLFNVCPVNSSARSKTWELFSFKVTGNLATEWLPLHCWMESAFVFVDEIPLAYWFGIIELAWNLCHWLCDPRDMSTWDHLLLNETLQSGTSVDPYFGFRDIFQLLILCLCAWKAGDPTLTYIHWKCEVNLKHLPLFFDDTSFNTMHHFILGLFIIIC